MALNRFNEKEAKEKSQGLKERYPYLAKWRESGLRNFPIFPELLIKRSLDYHLNSLRETIRKRVEEIPGGTPQNTPKIIDYLFEVAKEVFLPIYWNRFNEKAKEQEKKLLDAEYSARHALIYNGGTREELSNECKRNLPNVRGGKGIVLRIQHTSLKVVHKELSQCIREIKHTIGLPLKVTDEFEKKAKIDEIEGRSITPADIEKHFPRIGDIFEKKEMEEIFNNDPPSEIALEIISKRLQKNPNLRLHLKTHTLRHILEKKTLR